MIILTRARSIRRVAMDNMIREALTIAQGRARATHRAINPVTNQATTRVPCRVINRLPWAATNRVPSRATNLAGDRAATPSSISIILVVSNSGHCGHSLSHHNLFPYLLS